MNVRPMILRFCSGSVTPASRSRNRSGGVDEHQRQLQPLEAPADLFRFVLTHHAVVDEDARQPIADRAMDQHGRNRRIDAAAQAADDTALPDLVADPVRCLFHERGHRPVAGAAADFVGEVAEDVGAPIRMCNLRVEEECVHSAIRGGHRRDRRVGARRGHREAGRRRGDEVAMARPDTQLLRHRGEQRRVRRDADVGQAELAMRRRRHFPAERRRHQLHPVADPEDRDPCREHRRLTLRGTFLGDALRTSREDDPGRRAPGDLSRRRVERENLRVDRQLAQPPGDQLCELRSEIENDDGLV